jgi:hypothetical protein
MFVSGAHFQAQCRWNLDNRYPIRKWSSILELKTGDSVFLKVSDIPYFLAMRVTKHVSLVVHNSDELFTDDLYRQVKPYVTDVSAVNCATRHAKQLPLGLRDHQYASHHDLLAVMNEPPVTRDILCLVNFLLATNPTERQGVYDRFKNNPLCLVQHEYMFYDIGKSLNFGDQETQRRRLEFYRTLKRCTYAICPPGRGIDTHRVYECIYLGVIPIVRSSPLDPLYSGMPVKIVVQWADLIPWLEQVSHSDIQPPVQ